MLFVAYVVLKPRAPGRRPGQSVEEYWTTPAAMAAVRVWFVGEGAGMIAAVGYFLTGDPVALLAAAIAIGSFWRFGPSTFAQA